VDNLDWVVEVVQAADLEALGDILHHRLGIHVLDGAPGNERRLAERLAFEHQVRNYIARAQERGYLFARHFPGFASRWVDFVDQNKIAEAEIAKNLGHRSKPLHPRFSERPSLYRRFEGRQDIGRYDELRSSEIAPTERFSARRRNAHL
jgi:hypothetical protein